MPENTNPANDSAMRPFEVYNRYHSFVGELKLTPDAYRTLAGLGMHLSPVLDTDEEIEKWLATPVVDNVPEDVECQQLRALLDAALGGESRARQECNELYEEIALLKRELKNAQLAYNRTFDRMATIENEEQGR